jgi:hypothetical protein
VALQRLPVRFAIDRAGLVGADGATHAGAFDVGFLANLPGFVVMAPGDEAELVHMVATATEYDAGPISFRFPRGEGVGAEMDAGADLADLGCLLEHRHVEAAADQRERGRQAPDAATGNEDGDGRGRGVHRDLLWHRTNRMYTDDQYSFDTGAPTQ